MSMVVRAADAPEGSREDYWRRAVLTAGAGHALGAVPEVADPDGPPVLDQHPGGQGVGLHRQVGPVDGRPQVGVRRSTSGGPLGCATIGPVMTLRRPANERTWREGTCVARSRCSALP
jgi:hypothetical protein